MSAVSYLVVRLPRLLLLIASFAALPFAHAGKPPAAPDPGPPIDVAELREKLVVLGDGKQHYVALVPFGDPFNPVFYGDGKTFYKQRVFGGGSSGTESFRRSFWEPRTKGSMIAFDKGKYTVHCGDRPIELTPVAAAEQETILAGAKFFGPRWKHKAYALARDNEGKYYFVDREREPEQSRSFRLFVGTRGNMKQQKMINVVSDSEGDIFATKSGSLRLILDKHETSWVSGKKKTPLISLPLDDNHILIFTDLGAYTGQRLGTPCDDL
jgi:hypothetical protein